MDYLEKTVLIPFAVFWLIGLYAHIRTRPSPTDVHLPLAVRLLFGNPRQDGTLSVIGMYGQLGGYLLGILSILRGFRIINSNLFAFVLFWGVVLLSIWLFRSLQQEEKLGKQADDEINNLRIMAQLSIQHNAVELTFQDSQPKRNWWVVGFIVSAFSAMALGSIWVVWVMINLLLTEISSGKFANDLPFSITFMVFIILFIAGLWFIIVPIFMFLNVHFSEEGVRIFTFAGYRHVRWADVVQIHVKARDLIVLMTKEKNIAVPLSSFHAPEKIIAEIRQRAFGWKSLNDTE